MNVTRTIVYVTASWCQPCKQVWPHVEAVFPEVIKLDIESKDGVAVAGDTGVQSVPTLLVLDNGRPVHVLSGQITRRGLESLRAELDG